MSRLPKYVILGNPEEADLFRILFDRFPCVDGISFARSDRDVSAARSVAKFSPHPQAVFVDSIEGADELTSAAVRNAMKDDNLMCLLRVQPHFTGPKLWDDRQVCILFRPRDGVAVDRRYGTDHFAGPRKWKYPQRGWLEFQPRHNALANA